MPGVESLAGMQGAPEQGVGQFGGQGPEAAVKALMQSIQLMNVAIQSDPSLTHLLRPMMEKTFLTVSQHYGYGDEAKLAMKRAQGAGASGMAPGAPTGSPPGPPQGGEGMPPGGMGPGPGPPQGGGGPMPMGA